MFVFLTISNLIIKAFDNFLKCLLIIPIYQKIYVDIYFYHLSKSRLLSNQSIHHQLVAFFHLMLQQYHQQQLQTYPLVHYHHHQQIEHLKLPINYHIFHFYPINSSDINEVSLIPMMIMDLMSQKVELVNKIHFMSFSY